MINIAEKISKVDNHPTYSHTFLYWVIVKINYECTQTDNFQSYKKFFEAFRGLDFTREVYANLKTVPVRFRTNDNKLSVKIDDGFVQLKIRGDVYMNFQESVSPFLMGICHLFESINATVTRMELRKVNLWGYDQKMSGYGERMLDLILSKELNDNWKPIKQNEAGEEIKLTRLTGCEEIDGHEGSLGMAFGFIEPILTGKGGMSRVILDTEYEIEGNIASENMSDLFSQMNSRMYDMYHWAVSEKTLELMKL